MRAGLARDDDDGNLSRVGMRRDFGEDGLSADDGQAEIENDNIRRMAVDDAKRVEPVSSFLHVVAGKRQRLADHAAQGFIVFDDEDVLHSRHPTEHTGVSSIR